MLNVVHVITGLNQGGAETALFRLLKGQKDRSRFHVISLTSEGVFAGRLRKIGVRVTALGASSFGTLPFVVLRLVRVLRQSKPDVIQTWMYHSDLLGGIAARIIGIPVCWGIRHSNISKDFNKRSTLAVVRLCALLSKLIPEIIISCSSRAAYIHRNAGYADRFVVIPNGLNFNDLRLESAGRSEILNSLNLLNDTLLIGHVGRGDPQKDHATLMAVFDRVVALHPNARLLMVGKELCRGSKYFDGLISGYRFGDKVIGLGMRDDVIRLMQAMDVFVLSSVGEGFPNVVAEAMACGVPCVVTDVGDSAEIVGDTGWVREAGDVDGLAEAVVAALMEEPSARATRKVAAKERVFANYDISRMIASYELAWEQAAEGVP